MASSPTESTSVSESSICSFVPLFDAQLQLPLSQAHHNLSQHLTFPFPRAPPPTPSQPPQPHPPTLSPAIPPPIDYLAVLGLPAHASDREITSAWRDRVLALHPDKRGGGGGGVLDAGHGVAGAYSDSNSDGDTDSVDIRLVNEARWVLSDPARRREWEEAFEASKHKSINGPHKKDPHIFHEVSLSLFTPHHGTPPHRAAAPIPVPVPVQAPAPAPPRPTSGDLSKGSIASRAAQSTVPVDHGDSVQTGISGVGRSVPFDALAHGESSIDEAVPNEHYGEEGGEEVSADDSGAEPTYYTLPCRCSSRFVITLDDLEEGVDVVGCEGCGEWVRVGYEVVDGD